MISEGLQIPRDDERRHFEGKKAVKGDQPLLMGHLLQIGVLHKADGLQAHWLKVLKKAGQLHTGPVDIHRRDLNLFIVRRLINHL